ncbi:MoaA/NifB/PqqE/SkfB family radical SAM enzyme [Streptacidiphilus sp. BW17]|uniref:radical SAM protein n=1 Tax=unclassified Streptacidiphilus TaxID=2643834 RepID=UPI0035139368
MLKEVTGITRVKMLYLQLQYRCNFVCKTCFHGELLKSTERYTTAEAVELVSHFQREYGLEAVTLLGGEPLLYPGVVEVARFCKESGLTVEICTNGHRGFFGTVRELAPYLDKFRVSIDGLADVHDRIRQRGSFSSAIDALDLAAELGLETGVTMTVTRTSIGQVVALARLLDQHRVGELKLHCLRLVGNALRHPELEVEQASRYEALHEEIDTAGLRLRVVYDSDLTPQPAMAACSNLIAGDWLDRIEADPRGGLTVSCKAVGRDANAFRFDQSLRSVVYEPHAHDEIAVSIPDVVYIGN